MTQLLAITSETPIDAIRRLLTTPGVELSGNELVHASELAVRADAFDLAVQAMEAAAALSPSDAALHHRLGICLAKAGRPEAAASSLARAVAFDPTRVTAYQSLIALAVAAEDLAAAVFHARAQARACGTTPQLLNQTAFLLLQDGRPGDALRLVQAINQGDDATAQSLHLEAEIAYRLGLKDDAIVAARRCWEKAPDEVSRSLFLAQLYCNSQRYADALETLTAAIGSSGGDPRLFRLMSSALSKIGDHKSALSAAISAVQLSTEASEYWYNAAMLAHTLGFARQAGDLAGKAAELDPNNPQLWTAYARILQSIHRSDDAIRALDRAVALRPDDAAIKDFRIYILTTSGESAGMEDVDARPIKPLPRSKDRRRPHRTGEFWRTMRAAGVQFRVVAGLTSRAIAHRAVKSRFGFLAALFEPLVQILAVGVVLGLFNNSRPPMGNHFFFFYATGLLPLYLFIHVCNHTLEIFRNQQFLLQVPIIKRLDLVIGESLAELIICGSTTLLTFAGFTWLGLAPSSGNQMEAVEAYLALFALAFGLGLIGAVVNNNFPIYAKFWGVLQRALYFVSGVIIMAEHMPLWVRAYAVWNPLLLIITWFREGFFPQYGPPWLDKGYVIWFALSCVTLGLVLERASRRYMKLI